MAAKNEVYDNGSGHVARDEDGNYVVTFAKGAKKGEVFETIAPSGDDELDRNRAVDFANLLGGGHVPVDQLVRPVADDAPQPDVER